MLINHPFYSSLPSWEGLTHGRAQLQHNSLQNPSAGEEKHGEGQLSAHRTLPALHLLPTGTGEEKEKKKPKLVK